MTTSNSRGRRRTAYHHGDLRPALLRAAAGLLERHGPAALSLREAARRAGVSHAAPYRHFPGRDSLLAALAAEGFDALGQTLRQAAASDGLRGMGEAYVHFAVERPQRFRLMFGGSVPIADHETLRESASRVFDLLAQALGAQIPGPAGRDASLAAWSLVHGLSHLLLDERIAVLAGAGRDRDALVGAVLGSMRFAAAKPQTSL